MGAGIAETARDAGLDVVLHDPDPAARGRVEGVTWAEDLGGLAPCGVVIEAAPESLEVKRALFDRLAAVVAPDAVLATNTSSLLVSAIAAGVPGPERVVGLHFFNPVPRMRLVELVAGAASSDAALATARAAAEAMGKTVIRAADGPGFLVNRCNRPFSLEALRIVQERLATPEQVDRVCRLGLGFRMGPFELMDLVGIDVGLAIARSFHDQTHEPRWRPSPLAARMAASGRLGRKSGHGWYAYPPGPPARPPSRPRPAAATGSSSSRARPSRPSSALAAAEEAGWDVATPAEAEGELPRLIVDCGATEDDPPLQGGPQLVLCDAAPLAAQDPGGTAAGFVLRAPVPRRRAGRADARPDHRARGGRDGGALLRHARPPGRVGRRRAGPGQRPHARALVNEACFALGEGVGRRPTSTPAWSSASTTRAARSRGATWSAPTPCWRHAARAVGGVPRGALPTRAGARRRRSGAELLRGSLGPPSDGEPGFVPAPDRARRSALATSTLRGEGSDPPRGAGRCRRVCRGAPPRSALGLRTLRPRRGPAARRRLRGGRTRTPARGSSPPGPAPPARGSPAPTARAHRRRARGSPRAAAPARSPPRCARSACSTTPSRTASAARRRRPIRSRPTRLGWRARVVGAAVPPPVAPDSPLIGIVDTHDRHRPPRDRRLDHRDARRRRRSASSTAPPPRTVAAAPANGVGMLGVWPAHAR